MDPASLSRTVGSSMLGAATMPVRVVLWLLHGLLWLAIPAFLVAAALHYSAGDTVGAIRDVVFLLVSAVVLGLVRFARARIAN